MSGRITSARRRASHQAASGTRDTSTMIDPQLRQVAVAFGKTPDVAYHFEQDCGRVWQGES
jgi:hypothetical protein